MIPRLDEFTAEELQYLLVEVVAGIKRLEEDPIFPVYKLIPKGKYQALCLWRTQILNALSTVQMREREISN